MNPRSKPTPRFRNARRRDRRGFLYVAVLFTSLVVVAAVATALSISTMTIRAENNRSSRGDALWLAESELQRQLAIVSASSQWRSTMTDDTFDDWHALTLDGASDSEAVVRHKFTDVDGDLADDTFDPVQLTVHARVGTSHAALSVQLEPDPLPLALLGYSITATDDLRLENGGSAVTEHNVQVVDNCMSNSWGVLTTPQLEYGGWIQFSLRGQTHRASVELPSYDVVARYISLGTEIPTLAIPQLDGTLVMEDRLLTNNVNPLGPTSANGIYWIDAGGRALRIRNCRINATLAVTNCSMVEIGGGVCWRYPNEPDVFLATNTYVLLDDLEPTLDEDASSVNFNPATAPYRQNWSNTTSTDRFPTEFRGILYTSGDIRLQPLRDASTLSLTGSIMGRDIRVDGSVAIRSLEEVMQTPPLGLSDPTPMRIVRGSYRRIPTP